MNAARTTPPFRIDRFAAYEGLEDGKEIDTNPSARSFKPALGY